MPSRKGRGKRSDRVFLIDYGLACIAGDAERSRSSGTSTVWVEVIDACDDPQPKMAESLTASTPAPHEAAAAGAIPVDVAGGEDKGGKVDGAPNKPGPTAGEVLPKSKPAMRLGAGSTGLVGSVRYLSLAAHAGGRQTRQCDLESLAYVLLYLVRVSTTAVRSIAVVGDSRE